MARTALRSLDWQDRQPGPVRAVLGLLEGARQTGSDLWPGGRTNQRACASPPPCPGVDQAMTLMAKRTGSGLTARLLKWSPRCRRRSPHQYASKPLALYLFSKALGQETCWPYELGRGLLSRRGDAQVGVPNCRSEGGRQAAWSTPRQKPASTLPHHRSVPQTRLPVRSAFRYPLRDRLGLIKRLWE